MDLIVTADVNQEADIHIVSGPHYAKGRWTGHKTLLLDRAYYHEEKTGLWDSMDWVSLGWMNNNGSRTFRCGTGREPPVCKTKSRNERTIFLGDYRGPVGQADTVRLHPAEETPSESLLEALRRHGTAIGYGTTALVTAALEGLKVVCFDPDHIVNQFDWINLLPYADWHYSEIQSGEFWEHLNESYTD